ncbi:MAG: acetylglutamate kinase [Planctomycetes bacterium]|nr:acetylglutamate kinase [Planctomycetota bacterium]
MRDISILREALPYIRRHHGRRFVVKLGGGLIDEPKTLSRICEDIVLLHLVGVRVAVVHGGGPQADVLSERLGAKPQKVLGRRVTDEPALDVAKMVFAGKTNIELLSHLRHAGGQAVGLSGVDGGMILASRRPVQTVRDPDSGQMHEVDYGLVGDIERFNPTLVADLVEKGYIPVLAPLAADDQGQILNINADTVACSLAVALAAEKVILLSEVRGLILGGRVVSTLSVTDTVGALAGPEVRDGMRPKLEACLYAVRNGIPRAHLLSGEDPNALLLEMFTSSGTGTMILAPEEESRYRRELERAREAALLSAPAAEGNAASASGIP